jgi:hypothetical protein
MSDRNIDPNWYVGPESIARTNGEILGSWTEVVEPTVRCKHGKGDCERCGITERRDVMHRRRGR